MARIAIIGMMGSGKTAVSVALYDLIQTHSDEPYLLFEVDTMIEKIAGLSTNKIFEVYGETHFRTLEKKIISSMATHKNCVVSCGGGAVREDTLHLFRLYDHVIYLRPQLAKNVQNLCDQDEIAKRPMLSHCLASSEHCIREILKEKYQQRAKWYQTASNYKVFYRTKSAKQIAKKIYKHIVWNI